MAPRFNPRTGEWEGLPVPGGSSSSKTGGNSSSGQSSRSKIVAQAPSGTVARIGHWFRGYWADDIDNNAPVLFFLGYPIALGICAAIGTWAVLLLILFTVIPKTRTWVNLIAYGCFFPFAALLRYVFYNNWSLLCAIFIAIGLFG